MKLKFSQKLYLSYLQTKLKTLAALSPSAAAKYTYKLFCTPFGGKQMLPIPSIFTTAEKVFINSNGYKHTGFKFLANTHNGKQVLICHGFDSCCFKFEAYIQPLLDKGFNVLAFDATGHGLSEGKMIHSYAYSRMILAIEKKFGFLNGFIAHSLGGLATCLAIEELPDLQIRKLVLVAPASEASTALIGFHKIFPINEKTKLALNKIIFNINQQPIEWYSVNRVLLSTEVTTLWLHDVRDKICPYADTKPIREAEKKYITFVTTKGLGHSKIYKEQSTISTILQFLE